MPLTSSFFSNLQKGILYLLTPIILCALLSTHAIAKQSSADARLLNYYTQQLKQFEQDKKKPHDAGFKGFMQKASSSLKSNILSKAAIGHDLDVWIENNFHSPLIAKALYIRMDMLRNKKQSLIDAFYLMHVFADSAYASKARQYLRGIMEKKSFQHSKDELKNIYRLKLSGSKTTRHANLLKAMSALKNSMFKDALIQNYERFLASHRSHNKAPMVQKLLADKYSKSDKIVAAFHYNSLVKLYPSSGYVASSLVAMANIQRTHRDQLQTAIANYRKVTKRHAKTSAARQAYMQLAFIYERQLNDDDKALAAWAQVAKKHPRSQEAVTALQAMGRMYKSKKQYKKSIHAYRRLDRHSRNASLVITALKKSASMASKQLNDYKLMVKINKQMIKAYPKANESVEAMYNNAKAYENKLNQHKKAKATYRMIIKKHPQHRLAKKAQRQLH